MSERCGALLCALALLAGCDRMAGRPPAPTESPQQAIGQALVGEWYNTEIGRYPTPSITFVRFHPAGGVVIGGLDGTQRFGQYALAADGTLRVRVAERSHASVIVEESEAPPLKTRPSRLIIDSMPVVTEQTLELQARGRIFLLTRDPQQKQRIEAGMLAYREAHADALRAAELARAEAAARQARAESGEPARGSGEAPEDDENEQDAPQRPPERRVMVRFSGAGAGSAACTGALLQQIGRPGLRVGGGPPAALVEIELSGIAYRRGTWGRYHEVEYHARIRSAQDHQVLASLDATETASGSSAFEVCGDIGEDIGDELEDLLEIDD